MIKLWRNSNWPQISRAVLRDDGVHFLDYEGSGFKERKKADYASVEAMNKVLKDLGFGTFEVVNDWPLY